MEAMSIQNHPIRHVSEGFEVLPTVSLELVLHYCADFNEATTVRRYWASFQDFGKTSAQDKEVARNSFVKDGQFWKQIYKLHFPNPLHMAASKGNEEAVRALLNDRVEEEAKAVLNRPSWQCFRMDGQGTRTFLGERVDEKVKRLFSETPLHYAAKSGHAEVVKVLLEARADTEARYGMDGRTSLHHAVIYRYEGMVKVLLREGADIEATDNVGQTPLHLAAHYDHERVVRILLEAGANKAARNTLGERPFDKVRNSHAALRRLLQVEYGLDHFINVTCRRVLAFLMLLIAISYHRESP